MIPDDMDFIKMDITEPIILEQTFALPSTSLLDPTRTLCPICGEEKSTSNMRRHMKSVHKTEIDPDFNASILARLRGTSEVSNEEEPIFDDIYRNDPLLPENIISSQDENYTNVEYDEDTTSMDAIPRKPSKTRPKEKTDNCLN